MTSLDTDISTIGVSAPIVRASLLAAVAAPTLLLVASLVGIASGDYETAGWAGGVQLIAFAAYSLAFVGLAVLAAVRVPRLAILTLVIGVLVSAAGAGFGVDLMAADLHGERLPMPPNVAAGTPFLAAAGVLLPVSFALLGLMLVRARLVPVWLGALVALGGVLFPAGRIPRPPSTALIIAADLLLLVGLALVVMRLWPAGSPGRTDRLSPSA